MSKASQRSKARKARKIAEIRQEIKQLDHDLKRRQRQRLNDPLWYLADEGYNRHVVFWEAGTLEANFDADEEGDGWVSLTRGDGRSMWYNPTTRRAYWTGFDPRTEFFIKDIEAYIKQKFYS